MEGVTSMQDRLRLASWIVVAAGIGAGVGALVQGRLDDGKAIAVLASIDAERRKEREASGEREAHLNAIIDSEHKHHVDENEKRHAHLVAFTADRQQRMRDLEAVLADARKSGGACTERAARIAEVAADALDLLGEADGLRKEAVEQAGRLEVENAALAATVIRWQERYRAVHPQQVIVTGAKK